MISGRRTSEAKARNPDANLGDGVANGDGQEGHTKEDEDADDGDNKKEQTRRKEAEVDGGFDAVSPYLAFHVLMYATADRRCHRG